LPRGGPAARRPRRWSTHLLPWTNVPKSACKRIELSPGSFAALTGECPANHANLPASTGFFASRRSPVRSLLAPSQKRLICSAFPLGDSAAGLPRMLRFSLRGPEASCAASPSRSWAARPGAPPWRRRARRSGHRSRCQRLVHRRWPQRFSDRACQPICHFDALVRVGLEMIRSG
jgi:hypothetical protein